MTLRVRLKGSREDLEVLDFAAGGWVFVGPPDRPEEGRLVLAEDLEPDPWLLLLRHGFSPWTDRLPRPGS
ncbi:MAG TPA: hypothetical protein VGR28_03555 [Candidatus Thermoplasmatota archaeon]|jgi:hypothetical protein|nr:hypothetical protein [Candidatus Thermoplasmatota archaeon]